MTDRKQINDAVAALIKEKGNNQKAYTREQIALLNQFEGYGSLHGQVSSSASLFEYYTPFPVIETMMDLAYRYGYVQGGKVCEPSVGIGCFLHYFAPETQVVAYELSETSADIAKVNFPTFDIRQGRFEEMFTSRTGVTQDFKADFDLVIGNPPYGASTALHPNEKRTTKATTWEDYFTLRGMGLLRKGGLLVFIVPSAFLNRSENEARKTIFQKAELIDAYRLPHGSFDNTDVGTDIVIFKKK